MGEQLGEGGLKQLETKSQSAARRMGNGRVADEIRAAEVLPFEATLAYAFRTSGGKVAAVNAARLLAQDDPKFKRFVHAWDSGTDKDRGAVRLEDLCGAAELTPDEFLARIIPALWQRNTDISRIVAAIAQPQVVAATIEVATTGGTFGAKDRQMLLEASGFLPTKQGSTINIDASHKSMTVEGGKPQIEDGPGMPSFSDDITEFTGVIRGTSVNQKLLGSSIPLLPPATASQDIIVPIEEQEDVIDV